MRKARIEIMVIVNSRRNLTVVNVETIPEPWKPNNTIDLGRGWTEPRPGVCFATVGKARKPPLSCYSSYYKVKLYETILNCRSFYCVMAGGCEANVLKLSI